MHRSILALSLFIITSIIAVFWFSQRSSPSFPSVAHPGTPIQPKASKPIPSTTLSLANPSTTVPTMPRLRLDAHGHLIIDRHLRQFFDAHPWNKLADPNAQRLAMQRDLQAQLEPSDVTNVMKIFNDYQHYLDAVAVRENQQDTAHLNSSSKILSQQTQIDQLRDQYLGAAINQALFPQPHDVSTLAADQLSILQNTNLSPEDRIRQLSAMQKRLEAFAHQQDQAQKSATP